MRLFRLPRARRRLPRAPHDIRGQIRMAMGGFKHASNRRLLTSPRSPTSSLQGERAGGGRRSLWLPLPPALPFPLSVGLGPAWNAWQAVPSRAGPARKMAQQAVPGPLVRHDARLGTAREARVPCRPDILRAVPGTGPCRAEPGRPDGQVYVQLNLRALQH